MKNIDRRGRRIWQPHVRLYHDVLYSAAFRALSAAGRILLLELCGLYNGRNNGQIFLSVREAAKLMGMVDTGAASRAFRELIDHRLIVKTSTGAFSIKQRHASCWRLTFLPTEGSAATRDFANWKPTPGSPAAKRLRLLETCKLRSGFASLAVLESLPDTAKSLAEGRESVGETQTAIVQEAQNSVESHPLQFPTQLQYHQEQRASIPQCDIGRNLARSWLEARGPGMQRHLAREAGIGESKLSRFLKNASGRKTLTVSELERLMEVARKSRPIRLRKV